MGDELQAFRAVKSPQQTEELVEGFFVVRGFHLHPMGKVY
jgi:hypothetical protein|tara:strand:+ start:395 stop:514 length:120 start_codon:yes stop_codon:yes gene_type:complete